MAVVAWVAILVASNLSVVIWRVAVRQDVPPWDPVVRIAALVLLLAITITSATMRPLYGAVLALLVLLAGNWVATLLQQTAPWVHWTTTAPPYQQAFADMLTKLIPSALMGLTLIGSGLSRRDIFLVAGDLGAPGRWPGFGRVPWTTAAPILIALFILPLIFQLTLTARPDLRLLGRAATLLPLAVLFAVINAASEEFRFRAVLLGRAAPVLGRGQALWLTSVLFAIGHWFGHPSGPTGVASALIVGLVAAKSMLDTGGFAWAWFMHVIGDVVIFSFIVMGR